jgi:hypothetical protein
LGHEAGSMRDTNASPQANRSTNAFTTLDRDA